MPEYSVKIDLTIQGPMLTHSTAAGAVGISSPFAQDVDGHKYLPRTLVKGRLRRAWVELHSAAGNAFNPDIVKLLGERSDHSPETVTSVDPLRGVLQFEDFVNYSDRRSDIRYRVSIAEERGSVKKGFYQVLEAPYASGEHVSFLGRIHYSARDQNDAEQIRRFIEVGLRWITSLGAERTIGFGRLMDVSVIGPTPTSQPTAQIATTGGETLSLKIRPRSPFCVARRRIADNLFESDTILPGSVLKGSLASSWRLMLGEPPDGAVVPGMDSSRPELCEYFQKIRITHAFPAPALTGHRPTAPPLSLVSDADGQLYDVALIEGPIVIGHPPAAPEFAVDWKPKRSSEVNGMFGWASPGRDMRVRTAIDSDKRKAKEEQLFAYDMVVPGGSTLNRPGES